MAINKGTAVGILYVQLVNGKWQTGVHNDQLKIRSLLLPPPPSSGMLERRAQLNETDCIFTRRLKNTNGLEWGKVQKESLLPGYTLGF